MEASWQLERSAKQEIDTVYIRRSHVQRGPAIVLLFPVAPAAGEVIRPGWDTADFKCSCLVLYARTVVCQELQFGVPLLERDPHTDLCLWGRATTNASAHMDAAEEPQIHIDAGNLIARLNLDESSLSGLRRVGVEGGKVDVVTRVIRHNLLALMSGDDQILAGLEAEDAILAAVIGLSSYSWHEHVAGLLMYRPDGLNLRPDCWISVFVVNHSRDDARWLQPEDEVFSGVPGCEFQNLTCVESPPLPVALRWVSVSAGHQ